MITAIRGNTETASYIDATTQKQKGYFNQSVTLGKQSAYNELYAFWQECKSPNWDGYNALAVEEKTLFNAYWFIESLPLGYPLPSVGAEPDGHLTLEWYSNPRWILSVSISPESMLYYAALFGTRYERGSDHFCGEIPQSILELMKEVKVIKVAMNVEFRLDAQKTVQVVAMFLKLHGNKPMYYLGLIKLLYMADRLSLERFDVPVVGDRYFSMDKGPVLSGVYDLIKGKKLRDVPDALEIWSNYISPRNQKWEVELLSDPSDDELSQNDEEIIHEIYSKRGNLDRFDLVEITHQFPEWRNPNGSAIPIKLEEILIPIGKTNEQIKLIQSDIHHENCLNRILNYA